MTSLMPHEMPIAVVGLGCRLPGADDLSEYWKLISEGRSGIIELPPDKLDQSLYYHPERGTFGRSYSKIGGVVPERPLNPAICKLPKALEDNTDSAHLIMCEVAAMACRNAGYDPFNMATRNTGVYVGHSGGSTLSGEVAFNTYCETVAEYLREDKTFSKCPAEQQTQIIRGVVDRIRRDKARRNPDGGPEIAANMVSAVISQAFGLSGPALATDAACASSLIAMAMGIHALRNGQIDMAIVGGASCSKWYALVIFSIAQSISGTGSRPFDANADGLISSDGYAAVVLKTLPKAIADGDDIKAVIRGIGVSSDGRGKSLWAPRKEGQVLAVQRAYPKNVDPAKLQYLECHATSTQVGDATELAALTMALKDRLPADRKLPIGSVKANIGHTLESAGIAGFVKAVLCMQNKTIPGQINLNTPNPDIAWKDIPFYVPSQAMPWPEPKPGEARRTAVNAFGIGGLNVHVVMDDRVTESLKTQVVVAGNPTGAVIRDKNNPNDRAIAVIGMGAVLPGALTINAFWDLLSTGRDPKTDVPVKRWNPAIYLDPKAKGPWRSHNTRGGFITDFVYDWKKHKVAPKQIANANPLQFMLLDAADQALQDAGYGSKPFDRQRAAVIVGSVFGGDFACEMQMGLRIPEFQRYLRNEMLSRGVPENEVEQVVADYEQLLLKHMPALLDETGSFTASTLASRLTKTFDMMGGAFSIDAGDTSSMAAISAGIGMLLDQSVDMVMCAAGQRSMDITVYEGFSMRDGLAKGNPQPSFSQSMDGVVPGEGAAVVMLKRLADAQRDGDNIRGVIRGLGVALDAQHYPESYRKATDRALSLGQVAPDTIGMVEVASVGTKATDEQEVQVLGDVLAADGRNVPAVLSSSIGQIGHTLGMSGMVSLIKSVIELEHGQIPRTPGMDAPLPSIASHAETLKVAQESQTLFATLPTGKTVAAITNSGPNGAVYTMLLEGGQNLPAAPKRAVKAPAVVVGPTEWKTVRIGATSREALRAEVAKWQADPTPLFATGGIDHFNGRDAVRLAIVADNTQSLTKKLQLASEQLTHANPNGLLEQQGVYFRESSATKPKVAFLFPGQGSQYTGMLRDLVNESKAARTVMAELDDILVQHKAPRFAELAWTPNEQLGQDVFLTQLSMLVADTLVARVLMSEGLRPDVISSHSYGEFPALVAAGAMTFGDAIDITRERTHAVESRESTRGSLMSTTAPLDVVERLLSHLPGAAYLASHNAPDQTVVGGTSDAIHGVKRLLESEGFATRLLAVPRPYHTPLLNEAKPEFAIALQRAAVQAPQVKFLSSVSLDYVSCAEGVRKNLVEQLTTPVRYVQLIQRLAADGVNLFLEVGPQQVLTRLNQRILKDRPVSMISTDLPKHTGREALERLHGLLETAGLWPVAPTTPSTTSVAQPGSVMFFDATAKRRGGSAPVRRVIATVPAVREMEIEVGGSSIGSARGAKPQATTVAVLEQPQTVMQEVVTTIDRTAVQAFMINFIVDQTGYPADMVEMEADLEADLGIDSIKKAQLIGELAENFEMKHLADSLQDLSLDDFRTLSSLLDFVTKSPAAKVEVVEHAAESARDAKPQAVSVAVVEQPQAVMEVATTVVTTIDRVAVQAFMINFIVDQTGYPADMVEMEADLEADLGIDSIKKAQLIGELAENFEMKHLADSLQDLSLDDFRTLSSLLDFVTKAPAAATVAVEVVEHAVESARDAKPQAALVAVVEQSQPVTEAVVTVIDRGAVQQFMINFIVDQTGYPADMVEMEADLEADLGIDSIKKAQLIGELAENFEMKHLADSLQDLSLDDFRTLSSLLDFVTKAPAGATAVEVVEHAVESARDAKPQAVSVAVVEQSQPVAEPVITTAVSTIDRVAVQQFMVNFIVDQTGYPADMVEMEADLEADLGIDSIKKAQLIGELAENFEMKHLADSLQDLSLDDFRTLSSLLDFVTKAPAATAEVVEHSVEAERDAKPQAAMEAVVEQPQPVVESVRIEAVPQTIAADDTSVTKLPDAFSVVPIAGTPYEMGQQHGRHQSAEIKAIMSRYAAMLGPRLQNIPELDEALAKPTMYFGEQELEELHGIADGAMLPVPAVIAHNLGMYPDYVPGCTQFAYTRQRNPQHGLVHAVNEDSPLSLTLPDCLARIVQVRRPVGGIAHVTFSVAGQTGGLNGINAAGIAVSSTLLLDRPRRPSTAVGKVHPVVVKRLLEHSETIEDALAILRSLDRAGAWSLCISHHHTDRLCYVEYDGGTLQVQDGPKSVLTTNHCLLQDPIAEIPEHSRHRLNRLIQLVGEDVGGVTVEMAQQALRDRYDLGRGRLTPHATMNTIRRVDNQISIVMMPERGELFVTPGPRSGKLVDEYFRLDLKELLSHDEPVDETAAPVRLTSSPAPAATRPARPVQTNALAGLPEESQRVVQRHVLRMEESPLPEGTTTKPTWNGAAAILGSNKFAEALKTRLEAEGLKVHTLPNTGDVDASVAALNAAWSEGPVMHLFVATARDDASAIASVDGWEARRKIGAMVPFFVCQRWTGLVQEAKALKSATLVGVTALGGDFGFCGRVHGSEGGGITGLFKGIRREMPDLLVKVIDAPFEEAPATLIDAVFKELAAKQGPLEVGWVRGQRSIVKAVPQPASTQRQGGKTPHGNWIVTGGARGVTAVVARELGRRFGLTMHLIGSSTQPTIDPSWRNLTEEGMKTLKRSVMDQARAAGKNPANTWKDTERAIEIDRTLQAFRADGITVHYHACDVADRTKLGATLEAIRKLSGPIHGIIHGAGLEAACKFEKKKRELVEATIKVKIDAGLAMLELTQLDPLEWFIGFGSTSGRFGGMGQTDYSMAQDLLCKVCDCVRVRRPEVSAVGMHWPPWADVGMAARPESKIALQSSNLAFMPPLEGAAHVIDEMLTEALEGEVLYLDKPDMIDTDGTMPDASTKAEYLRRDPLVKSLPIIDTIHALSKTSLIGKAVFDPAVEPFLLEHRYQGVSILPAVVGLESMAEGATLLTADNRPVVGVRNMTVHQGFRFHLTKPQRARVVAKQDHNGVYCRLEADFLDRVGRLVEAHRLQMDATLDLSATYPQLAAVDMGAQPTAWTKHQYVVDWRTMKFPEEARVYHGYPFQALTDYALVDGGIWAHIVVPKPEVIAGKRPAAGWLLPSSAIDAGLLASDLYVWNTYKISDLPYSFDRIQFARAFVPGETLTMRMWVKERQGRKIRADFVYVDANGKTVMQVDGYEMVETRAVNAATSEAASTPAPEVTPTVAVAPVAKPAPQPQPTVTPTTAGPAPAPAPTPLKSAAARIMPQVASPAPAPLPVGYVNGSGHKNVVVAPTSTTTPIVKASDIAELPMIDSAKWTSAAELVAEIQLDPANDLFLIQHTFGGKPLLPAVFGLETMIQAASLTQPGRLFDSTRDFQIIAPCKFRDQTPATVKVVAQVDGDGVKCRLMSTSGKEVVYQSVTVMFADQAEPVLAPTLESPPFPYSPMNYAEGKQAQLLHGPLFRCLKGLCLQRDGGWGKVTAAAADNLAGNRKGTRWFLPTATLDSCLVATGVDLFILMTKRTEIPHRMEEIRVVRLPKAGEACVVRLNYKGHTDRHTTYDLILYGANKEVLLTVKNYQGIRTSKDADSSLWSGEVGDDRLAEIAG